MHASPARLFAAACLLLAPAACTTVSTAPDPGATAPAPTARWAGDTLALPFGGTAEVGAGARLTFVGRGEDSRCPINANCVWEGDVTITVRVSPAGGGRVPAVERAVHTSRRVGPDTVTGGGVTVRLAGLTPYPAAGGPRPADADAVALFVPASR